MTSRKLRVGSRTQSRSGTTSLAISRLKVLHLIVAGQIGGAERFLVNLATRPDRSGADHCLALLTPNPALRDFFKMQGLRLIDRGPAAENPLAYLWRSWGPSDLAWLGRVMAQEKPDILHCHTYGSHVLAVRAGLRLRVPVIRTEHGVRHYRDPSCAPFRGFALRHTDRIVAVSRYVAAVIASLAPAAESKTSVVWNGIDLGHFKPAPFPAEAPLRIAAVTRLEPIKRLHLAIEALALAPEAALDIVGDGVERGRLETLARQLGVAGRVQFLGHQKDPRPFLAKAQAVINVTREEGLSLALLEAAAMARPALAFAAGGVPEVVDDGKTGLLTQNQTAEGLAALLRKAAAAPEMLQTMGLAARNRAEHAFGIETMCEAYGAVYRDAVSAVSPRFI